MLVALILLLALDGWLVAKRHRYVSEIQRLRAGMTDFERRKTDAIATTEENRFRVTLELIRRQARGDQDLHLSVSVDSGAMFLQREGRVLREMLVEVGPERTVGTAPDTVRLAIPRGERTVERILGEKDAWEVPDWVFRDRGLPVPEERNMTGALGPTAVVLNGGTVIYTLPSTGPLNDSTYVLPGSFRMSAADLRAVTPNLQPGMRVYLY